MKEQKKNEKKKSLGNKNKHNHSSSSQAAIDNLSASSSNLNLSNYEDTKPSSNAHHASEVDTASSLRRNANENRKKETGVSKALENLKSDREKKKKIGLYDKKYLFKRSYKNTI